jgi:hypothetical protein
LSSRAGAAGCSAPCGAGRTRSGRHFDAVCVAAWRRQARYC